MTTPNRGLINQVENTLQPGVAFNWLADIFDRRYGSLAIEFASDADLVLSQVQSDYAVLFLGDSGPVLTGPVDVVFPDAFPMQLVVNNTAEDLTLRKDGGTGVVLAAGDSALIACGDTDVLVALGVGGAGLTDGDKGDVVVSSSGAVWLLNWAASTFDNDSTLAANSSTRLATQQAVKTAIAAAIAGLSWKQAVRVATTANGTLATAYENGDTVDGVTLATGDRILLKNQSTASENGIYVVAASGAPTRAADADSGAELVNASCYVSEGTTNADTQWTCTTNGPITVGSTSLTFAQLATGGTTGVTTALATASPNNTVNASSVTASGGTTNQDLVVAPKGTGALLSQVPDGTTTGGNKRGAQAVDLQLSRGTASQVASGANSALLGGTGNTASGTSAAVVAGTGNNASGNYSLAIGNGNAASGENSFAHGRGADTRGVANSRSCSSHATGFPQFLEVPFGALTTNATPTVLTSDNAAAAATNQFVIPQGASMLRVVVAAHHASNSDAAGWDIPVLIKNIGGTTSIVGTPVTTQTFGDTGAAAWTVAVTANNTLGCLTITGTGAAGTNIYWSARVIGPHAQ